MFAEGESIELRNKITSDVIRLNIRLNLVHIVLHDDKHIQVQRTVLYFQPP